MLDNLLTPFYHTAVPLWALIDAFFLYSFLGWCMERVVIRREKGEWENRGFVRSPFCIIYGFGAMLGYALLRPFAGNYVVLYVVGAVAATAFEYLTALLMLRLFGTFWWDYTNKPFNYRGIICLESTLGWGLVSVLLFAFMQNGVFTVVRRLSPRAGMAFAVVLVALYAADFAFSMRRALHAAAPKEAPAAPEKELEP